MPPTKTSPVKQHPVTDSKFSVFRQGQTLHVHYLLESEDHIAFARFVQWDAPERRGYRLFVIGLPLMIGVFFMLSQPAAARAGTASLLFTGLCGLGGLLTPWWMRYRIGWRVGRHLRANPKAGLTGNMRLELNPGFFAVEGPNGRSQRAKGAIFIPRETKNHFFFFVGDKAAYVLPKSPFKAGELDQIRLAAAQLTQTTEQLTEASGQS